VHSFEHIAPPLRLFSGPQSLGMLDRELERVNSARAVVFCGSSLARQGTSLGLVRSVIGNRCAGVFTGVRAHSPLPSVEAGADELKRLEADAVIALGGGSAIVTARAASILLAEGGDLRRVCTRYEPNGRLISPKLLASKLPQLVIPTTPTTAVVKTGSAVFDPASGQRLALFDPKTRAQSVFIHPETIRTAPNALLVSASLNTLALAVEGLISRSGDPISDALLIHSLRLLARHLPNRGAYEDPVLRSELMVAAVLCGQGSDYTGAGIATVLGHAVGARYDVDNGLINAIMLPHVLRFNGQASAEGFAKIGVSLDLSRSGSEPGVASVIDAVEAIFHTLGVARRLRDVGVPREGLSLVAADATGDWFLRFNPRPVRDASELQEVLEEAW
jgi:alcohol dehydrogenase